MLGEAQRAEGALRRGREGHLGRNVQAKNEEHQPGEGVLGGTRGRGGGRVLPAGEIKAQRPDGKKSRST